MTLEATHYRHPPIPAHLAGIHRLGISLVRWTRRAAERHALREEASAERVRLQWDNRCELRELERQRDAMWAIWQLHHLR